MKIAPSQGAGLATSRPKLPREFWMTKEDRTGSSNAGLVLCLEKGTEQVGRTDSFSVSLIFQAFTPISDS